MDLVKPIIIFTTFWDATSVYESGGFMIDDKIIKFDPNEVELRSIALAQPKGKSLPNLSFLNPTWDILKEYKADRDWQKYTNEYKQILVENRLEIADWIDSLENKVYILCCWENTCKGANCHRKIVFDALNSSNRTKSSALYIYRDGDSNTYNQEKQIMKMHSFLSEEEVTI
jgi:hypothetical protein